MDYGLRRASVAALAASMLSGIATADLEALGQGSGLVEDRGRRSGGFGG